MSPERRENVILVKLYFNDNDLKNFPSSRFQSNKSRDKKSIKKFVDNFFGCA